MPELLSMLIFFKLKEFSNQKPKSSYILALPLSDTTSFLISLNFALSLFLINATDGSGQKKLFRKYEKKIVKNPQSKNVLGCEINLKISRIKK